MVRRLASFSLFCWASAFAAARRRRRRPKQHTDEPEERKRPRGGDGRQVAPRTPTSSATLHRHQLVVVVGFVAAPVGRRLDVGRHGYFGHSEVFRVRVRDQQGQCVTSWCGRVWVWGCGVDGGLTRQQCRRPGGCLIFSASLTGVRSRAPATAPWESIAPADSWCGRRCPSPRMATCDALAARGWQKAKQARARWRMGGDGDGAQGRPAVLPVRGAIEEPCVRDDAIRVAPSDTWRFQSDQALLSGCFRAPGIPGETPVAGGRLTRPSLPCCSKVVGCWLWWVVAAAQRGSESGRPVV